jgi:expansin (peptidoglycan-binding protein)
MQIVDVQFRPDSSLLNPFEKNAGGITAAIAFLKELKQLGPKAAVIRIYPLRLYGFEEVNA